MDWISQPESWIALITLIALEIVLGIDNIVFISIVSGKLPKEKQKIARLIGLGLAMFMRVLLLFFLSWLMGLTKPVFTLLQNEISGRDIILILGGLFLLAKSTLEIHHSMEESNKQTSAPNRATFLNVLIQILLLDIVFSFDSVITAVGMVDEVQIMVIAVVVAVFFMMFFVNPVSRFVEEHPTVKMLALSFLLLIGVALIADGLDLHIPKGYIYFAMAFSIFVEMLNLRLRKAR